MKKEYVKPVMVGERFVADEYVSACWYGECNIDGKVYLDTNGNKQYDAGTDNYKYKNSACKHTFEITGVNNGYDEATDFINAFVVGTHLEWVKNDKIPFLGGWFEEVTETIPVYNYDNTHVSKIDSIQRDLERPNHS